MNQYEAYPEEENNHKRIEPFFYFRYQMKIQFIPHIQQEITLFVQKCKENIDNKQLHQQIIRIIRKKVRNLDEFFEKNWNDFRASLILRGRKLLISFLKQYNHILYQSHEEDEIQAQPKYIQQKVYIHEQPFSPPIQQRKSQPRLQKQRQPILSPNVNTDSKKKLLSMIPQSKPTSLEQIKIKNVSSAIRIQQVSPKQIKKKVEKVEKPIQKKISKQQYIAYLKKKQQG